YAEHRSPVQHRTVRGSWRSSERSPGRQLAPATRCEHDRSRHSQSLSLHRRRPGDTVAGRLRRRDGCPWIHPDRCRGGLAGRAPARAARDQRGRRLRRRRRACKLGLAAGANAQSAPAQRDGGVTRPATRTSLGPLKQIDAGVLNVGYAEAGPVDGPPVILLHGWPYDIYSFVDVAPLLASAGYRVIVPFVRGYGTTSFLSNETFRNGQPSAVASDTIALMDALKIDKAVLAGFDWGARTADIIAALWPERW